ncbi:hypothetical protein HDV00_001836 [Rhizophlyctis rosea]|nr:hypothetical protein HDV00_001836 [Rhizophlyctis rosea]
MELLVRIRTMIVARDVLLRPSTGYCDIPEYCDGKNATCPTDGFLADGTDCQTKSGNQTVNAQCAAGLCTSRDLQCKNSAGGINTTSVCPGHDSECQLLCQDTSGMCLMLNGYFQDGTPCGIGGRCNQGTCDGSNFFANLLDWMRRNLPAAISIGVLLGCILICIIVALLRCIFCPQRRVKAPKVHELRVDGPPQPIPLQPVPRGWVDPTPWNGQAASDPGLGLYGTGTSLSAYPPPAPASAPPAGEGWRSVSPANTNQTYNSQGTLLNNRAASPVVHGSAPRLDVPISRSPTFTNITPVREVLTRSSNGSLRDGTGARRGSREVVTSTRDRNGSTLRRGDGI